MAGPYIDNDNVAVLGIADRSSSSEAAVQNWINIYGWDFPTGIDESGRKTYVDYGVGRDTFVIVDQDGIVQWVRGYGNSAGVTFPLIHQKVNELLGTPVNRVTWGRIKSLYK